MKRLNCFGLLIGTLFLIQACTQPEVQPLAEPEDDLSSTHEKPLNFTAHLSGDQEVPPANTSATGQVKFQVSKDGTTLSFKLIVANIQNVTMAHIHLAPAGVNGPVVLWLYPSGPPPQLIPGRTDGILSQGIATSANLIGLLSGAALEDLVAAIHAGNAYVNVHTSQFPAGEIRGQIK
jgi:hypothetical protein